MDYVLCGSNHPSVCICGICERRVSQRQLRHAMGAKSFLSSKLANKGYLHHSSRKRRREERSRESFSFAGWLYPALPAGGRKGSKGCLPVLSSCRRAHWAQRFFVCHSSLRWQQRPLVPRGDNRWVMYIVSLLFISVIFCAICEQFVASRQCRSLP